MIVEDHSHFTNCGSDCSTPELHGDNWIESSYGGLKGYKGRVLVWKDSEVAIFYT
jgi:hypothetical protein